MAHSKAVETYRNDLKDVEVQMLSKLCKAVQEFEKKAKPMHLAEMEGTTPDTGLLD